MILMVMMKSMMDNLIAKLLKEERNKRINKILKRKKEVKVSRSKSYMVIKNKKNNIKIYLQKAPKSIIRNKRARGYRKSHKIQLQKGRHRRRKICKIKTQSVVVQFSDFL